MKKITNFIVFTILIVSLASCSNDDTDKQTYIYKSEKINLTELISFQGTKMTKAFNKSAKSDFIHSEFETTFYIPENFDQNEIENYVEENQSSISGTLKYFINDRAFIEIEIIDGEKANQVNYNYASMFSFFLQKDEYPKKDECSYDGIQDCVQYAIYEQWTTYTTLKCAFTGGLACIADEAASCIEKNCIEN